MFFSIQQAKLYVIFLTLLFVSETVLAFIVTHKAPESDSDERSKYEIALIKLALEKSSSSSTPYIMRQAPVMTVKRSLKSLEENSFTNLILGYPYDERLGLEKGLDFVRFPIDLGILGVRTCFVSDNAKSAFEKVISFDDFVQFSHGQGSGWADVDILRNARFNVVEIDHYETLFRMLNQNRFDLFCRGANEVLDEFNSYREKYNLIYDTKIAIRYSFPRFLYFNKSNVELGERITEGLLKAYEDGSILKLWHEMHKEDIEFVNLKERKIFDLENPKVKSLTFDYEQYFADWVKM